MYRCSSTIPRYHWAADVKDSTDYRTLGLREFYLKNFPRAAEYFTGAALQGETGRKPLKEQLRQEDLSTFENRKDAGNSLSAAYKFREALEVRTLEHLPVGWAQTQNNLAQLYESQENWPAAIECCKQVFKVYPGYAAGKLAGGERGQPNVYTFARTELDFPI